MNYSYVMGISNRSSWIKTCTASCRRACHIVTLRVSVDSPIRIILAFQLIHINHETATIDATASFTYSSATAAIEQGLTTLVAEMGIVFNLFLTGRTYYHSSSNFISSGSIKLYFLIVFSTISFTLFIFSLLILKKGLAIYFFASPLKTNYKLTFVVSVNVIVEPLIVATPFLGFL